MPAPHSAGGRERPGAPDADELRSLLRRDPVQPEAVRGGRHWRLGLVAVPTLAAAVALGAYLLAGSGSPAASGAAQPMPVVTGDRSQRPVEDCCTTPTVEPASATALRTAPPDVRWELFQGVALPVSAVHGPTQVDGAVYAGFSRTPTGALLADAQINVRRIATPDIAGLRAVAERQILKGPGQKAHLSLVDALDENDSPAGGYSQYVGFRMITWTPELAVVSLATRSASGRLQVGTDTLRWVDGDWRVELPADGLQRPQLVADLAGFVPWSGVG